VRRDEAGADGGEEVVAVQVDAAGIAGSVGQRASVVFPAPGGPVTMTTRPWSAM
jgi:hypothetical protein